MAVVKTRIPWLTWVKLHGGEGLQVLTHPHINVAPIPPHRLEDSRMDFGN